MDAETFQAVLARLATVQPRGRHANTGPAHIFAGLLRCPHCGGTVTRVKKPDAAYLICADIEAAKEGVFQWRNAKVDPHDKARHIATLVHDLNNLVMWVGLQRRVAGRQRPGIQYALFYVSVTLAGRSKQEEADGDITL